MSALSKLSISRRNNGVYHIVHNGDGRRRRKSTSCRNRYDALWFIQTFSPPDPPPVTEMHLRVNSTICRRYLKLDIIRGFQHIRLGRSPKTLFAYVPLAAHYLQPLQVACQQIAQHRSPQRGDLSSSPMPGRWHAGGKICRSRHLN